MENKELVPLYADETVSDLARDGLRLIQPQKGFRFGEDTVLLADYAAQPYTGQSTRRIRVADLGAGCGASTILLATRLPAANFYAIEIDPHSVSALFRNVRLDHLADRVTILESDYHRWTESMPCAPDGTSLAGQFDLVVANPPYDLGRHHDLADKRRQQAREERTMTLDSLIRASTQLLRPHGRLVLIHRTARMTEVLSQMSHHLVEPKTLRLIQSVEGRPPARFLVSGIHHSRKGSLAVSNPLIIRDSQHHVTDEIRSIYDNEPLLPDTELYHGLGLINENWHQTRERTADDAHGGNE